MALTVRGHNGVYMSGQVIRASANGAEVEKIIRDVLLPVIGGMPLEIVSAAFLCVIIASMKPDVTAEQLAEGAEQASGFISAWISTLDGDQGSVN